jgi:superoxide reductase
MREVNYYKCPVCGNVIEVVNGDVNRVRCCGQELVLLEANTVDAALEKHVPVYEVENNEIVVKVGEVIHPMEEKHYITFVSLVTNDRVIRVDLKPGDEPVVRFPYVPGSVIYEYCNLHGLWKNDVK